MIRAERGGRAKAGTGGGVRVLGVGLRASFDAVGIAGTAVLAHRHLPVVAFSGAELQPGSPIREFMAPPSWAVPFADAGLRLLDPVEPGSPIDRVDLGALAPAELKQIRHWQPQTLGELMFNWWD